MTSLNITNRFLRATQAFWRNTNEKTPTVRVFSIYEIVGKKEVLMGELCLTEEQVEQLKSMFDTTK